MQYAQARPYIKSGDVLLFRGTGLMAWIVRLKRKSQYSHAGIAWCVGERVLVLESRPKHCGVTIDRQLSAALDDMPTWIPSWAWDSNCEARALSQLGVAYGWLNAIRAGLGMRPKGKTLDCSEYVAYVLGMPTIYCETPQTLANRLSTHPMYTLEP